MRTWIRLLRSGIRLLLLTVLLLLLGALVASIVYRSSFDAQARMLAVLTTTARVPVLSWATRVLTDEPRVEEVVLAGVPTTLARPGEGSRWPALIFVNGATARGRHHPKVQRLARALARAGYLVLVPDLPGLARGEITVQTAAATVAVARAATERPDVRGGRVGFFGVSVGTTLALLAAEDPGLAPRVTLVAGLAPSTDFRKVMELATTGFYRAPGGLVRYRASSSLALIVARSVVAGLPEGPDRRLLLSTLPEVDGAPADPLAGLRSLKTSRLAPVTRTMVALLLNRDPRRFDQLYAALPGWAQAHIELLSPIAGASRLRAPVELASAPHDKYFPLAESRALGQVAPHVRLTVTHALTHAVPKLSLGDLTDLVRFDAFGVRVLRAARG